ncbi:hypothetical protein G7046_g3377 [Stylonectria norvegica]|nr:hypothetical protein G7046_g3377 [Stylonectria norvegica]
MEIGLPNLAEDARRANSDLEVSDGGVYRAANTLVYLVPEPTGWRDDGVSGVAEDAGDGWMDGEVPERARAARAAESGPALDLDLPCVLTPSSGKQSFRDGIKDGHPSANSWMSTKRSATIATPASRKMLLSRDSAATALETRPSARRRSRRCHDVKASYGTRVDPVFRAPSHVPGQLKRRQGVQSVGRLAVVSVMPSRQIWQSHRPWTMGHGEGPEPWKRDRPPGWDWSFLLEKQAEPIPLRGHEVKGRPCTKAIKSPASPLQVASHKSPNMEPPPPQPEPAETRPSAGQHETSTSIRSRRSHSNANSNKSSGASISASSSSASDDVDDVRASSTQKAFDILAACSSRDIGWLKSLAQAEGGFLTDALRKRAWPVLLGLPSTGDGGGDGDVDSVDSRSSNSKSSSQEGLAYPELSSGADDSSGDWKELPRHRDEDQVQLDVNRSFIYYPHNLSDAELNQRKSELSVLITEVLRRYPYLCYFQGYHDICQVFLLVLDPALRARAVARLSVLRIRDFMLPTLAPTTAQLRLLPDILAGADPKLRRHLSGVEPFYALAGTLTMYAHNIEGYRDIARLFDVFLSREPVFSIYMFAQIILDRRDEIFEIDEPDMLHVILGKVPPRMKLDGLIADSVRLFERFPPETLRSWSQISSSSSLKTARNAEACAKQTMDEGARHFQKQAKELQWAELQDRIKWTLWAYRRPARAVGMAVAVAALAFYFRRNPALTSRLFAFFS